jgi:hypothetical protein
MKKIIPILLSLSFALSGSSQNFYYEIVGKYQIPVKKEKLIKATLLRDINEGYPSAWVTDYISTELTATNAGMVRKATGKNENLSPEQKELLRSADLNTDLDIAVKYKKQDNFTHKWLEKEIHYQVTVLAETQAEFMGGASKINEYLMKNGIEKLHNPQDTAKFPTTKVEFVVNEIGEISDIKLLKPSANDTVNSFLLQLIAKMPKWKPASDSKGVNLKQHFVLVVGSSGC